MSEPAVRISGIVLASLMFQHANSDSDVVRARQNLGAGRFRSVRFRKKVSKQHGGCSADARSFGIQSQSVCSVTSF